MDLQVKYRTLCESILQGLAEMDDKAAPKRFKEAGSDLFTLHPFTDISTSVFKKENKSILETDYCVTSFEDALSIELIDSIRHHQNFQICRHCGRLFIPKRVNSEYSTRPAANGKTCAEIGYARTFNDNMKGDELLSAYTRAYKAHYARMTKPRKKSPNITRDQFDAWYKEAKYKLELARAGVIDQEEYKAWLKK